MDITFRFEQACRFLLRCQGTQHDPVEGTVAPWELNRSLPFQQDFHDTLQAIWTWARYRELSGDAGYDDNVVSALSYIRDAFDDHVLSPKAGIARHYDAAFMLIAEVQCRRSYGEWPLQTESAASADILLSRARAVEGTDHIARHYTDPFFHMYALVLWAKSHEMTEAGDAARDAIDRGVALLIGSKFCVPMDKEPCPAGPGSHDFMSKGGSMLLAAAEACLDISSIAVLTDVVMPKPQKMRLDRPVFSWPKRPRDPSPFAMSAAWGLAAAARTLGHSGRFQQAAGPQGNVKDDAGGGTGREDVLAELSRGLADSLVGSMWDEFEKRGGGIGRSSDFAEAESWATFYLIYAANMLYT